MGISEFSYLWTTEKQKFRLEKCGNEYAIMDYVNGMMLLIEDDELYDGVVSKMIEEGSEIIVKNEVINDCRTQKLNSL